MGLKRYRGTVNTVATAAMDHRVLTIICQRCKRSSNMWAYKFVTKWPKRALVTPLHQPVDGFFCYDCQCRVKVYILAEGPWN